MNIEEYLEKYKSKFEEYDNIMVSVNDLREITDYTINLQKENERLKYYLTASDEEKQKYINNLERINNEQCKAIKDCKAYIDECVRLQAIIYKAIEYIVTHREAVDERDEKIIFWLTDDFDEEDLLNILEGEDNE